MHLCPSDNSGLGYVVFQLPENSEQSDYWFPVEGLDAALVIAAKCASQVESCLYAYDAEQSNAETDYPLYPLHSQIALHAAKI